eukprot:TRINITY_DN59129_c0_g2_i1.p1 TRINITY_DN59129_c0_g2~~TRINITY_DN59129_c0_g2_i1.p1  ORF type:complete len:1184 (+),score=222.24 TRINITY_DN59129_c0_g2_i1:85-3636(+)
MAARPDREERLQKLLESQSYRGSAAATADGAAETTQASPSSADNSSAAPATHSQQAAGSHEVASKLAGDHSREWSILAKKLPVGRDATSQAARKRLFSLLDPNGNGILSLAEVDKGISLTLGQSCHVAKPAINRAFHAARKLAPPVAKMPADYIDWNEFRVLLVYIVKYSELWDLFADMDTDGDRRLSFDEFQRALPLLQEWGASSYQSVAQDPQAAFATIDCDGGGMVLFDEFAHWALQQGLGDLADDHTADREEALQILRKQVNLASESLKGGYGFSASGAVGSRSHGDAGATKSPAADVPAAAGAEAADTSGAKSSNPWPEPKANAGPVQHSWATAAKILPVGRDRESQAARRKLFSQFDPNGNGILSLAEVDKGLSDTLGKECVVAKPAINRAFHAARGIAPAVGQLPSDYVDWNQFRVLLVYVVKYLELWELFADIDTNDDRRISFLEFQTALPVLQGWGAQAYPTIAQDPQVAFQGIDRDGGGMVLFDEFAHWALQQGVSDLADDHAEDRAEALELLRKQAPNLCADTLARDRERHGSDHKLAKPPLSPPTQGHAKHGKPPLSPSDCGWDAKAAKPPLSPTPTPAAAQASTPSAAATPVRSSTAASPNPRAKPGPGHSDWSAIARKLPTGRDADSQKARKSLFSRFDPNGNGILSLAEIDKGIGETLGPYCKVAKPAVNRAFHAARRIAAPVATIPADYVDWNQFRVLLIYVVKYLELYELFEDMDTDGDHRLSFREFHAALPLLQRWGAAGYASVALDPQATFRSIDRDGGGMVLFDEFAQWALDQGLGDLVDDHAPDRAEALTMLRNGSPNLCSASVASLPGYAAPSPAMRPRSGSGSRPGSAGRSRNFCAASASSDAAALRASVGGTPKRAPSRERAPSVDAGVLPPLTGQSISATRLSPGPKASPSRPASAGPSRPASAGRSRPPSAGPGRSGTGLPPPASAPQSAADGANGASASAGSSSRPASAQRSARKECHCGYCPFCRRRIGGGSANDVREAVARSMATYAEEQGRAPGGQSLMDGRADGPVYDNLLGGSSVEDQQRALDDIARARSGDQGVARQPGAPYASSFPRQASGGARPGRPSSANGRQAAELRRRSSELRPASTDRQGRGGGYDQRSSVSRARSACGFARAGRHTVESQATMIERLRGHTACTRARASDAGGSHHSSSIHAF